MYQNIKSRIQYNKETLNYFECNAGVRQGENLSPFLFSLYLNDLEDLNVIFYQNMPNLHNRYISAERKISHGPLPNLCLVILTSNQDGHQAKNRKRG
jgi:hypothetical protein